MIISWLINVHLWGFGCSHMIFLVEKILLRNVKKKQEYQDLFPISKIYSPFWNNYLQSTALCYLLDVLYGINDSSYSPFFVMIRAMPVGAVSYVDIEGYRMKRDVLFCYDLKLPDGFIPHNEGKPTKFSICIQVLNQSFRCVLASPLNYLKWCVSDFVLHVEQALF